MKLSKRQEKERVFHNTWAENQKKSDFFYKEAFESPAALENKFILSRIGELKDATILDLGCGLGDASVYFAKKGATVESIDISDKMVEFLNGIKTTLHLDGRIHTKVCPAETIDYPDNIFDFVYGNGVLHHVDIKKTQKEIFRVLKKGGKAYFIEPLSYNPIINVYRSMASQVRTEDEKPLQLHDIHAFISKFTKGSHQEFHLSTLFIFLYFYFFEKVHPNAERYWKKILKEGHKYETAINVFSRLDTIMFTLIPFLRRFAWVSVIEVQK